MVIELTLKNTVEAKLPIYSVTSLIEILSSASGRMKMVVNVGNEDTWKNRLLRRTGKISLLKLFARNIWLRIIFEIHIYCFHQKVYQTKL